MRSTVLSNLQGNSSHEVDADPKEQSMVENGNVPTANAKTAQPALTLDAKGLGAGLATAAVVGVGVALIEVAWIPGILIGVAAMAFPRLLPSAAKSVKPLLHSAIKTGYAASQKTREWVAEAGEQVSDMVAEVRSAAIEEVPANTASQTPIIEPSHTVAETVA